MTRIAVDGIDGAGKTTFARRLAELLQARVVSVDAEWMAEARARYERRYHAGQRLYISEVDPRGKADIVVAA